jgi:hypothetical protein
MSIHPGIWFYVVVEQAADVDSKKAGGDKFVPNGSNALLFRQFKNQ